MQKYIVKYFRDGDEISGQEWCELLDKDIIEEKEATTWDVSNYIMTDISEGRDVEVNHHHYAIRNDLLYDSAKELLEDLLFDYGSNILTDVLKEMEEKDLFKFLSKVERVEIVDNKLILKDEKWQ